MSFSIVLQTNSSDRGCLDKTLTDVATLTGVLREKCDLRDPVILISADLEDVADVNYFTISEFGRSYYMSGPPRIIRQGVLEISGHCDVLVSFAEAIRQQHAIVHRAQSADAYNLYLDDGSLKMYANPHVLTEPFPQGFSGTSFIMAVAGNAGGTP